MEEFKQILKEEGLNGKKFCDMMGINYNSYRTQTQSGKKVPKWVKSFVFGYKLTKL